jgi:hypothetical protein
MKKASKKRTELKIAICEAVDYPFYVPAHKVYPNLWAKGDDKWLEVDLQKDDRPRRFLFTCIQTRMNSFVKNVLETCNQYNMKVHNEPKEKLSLNQQKIMDMISHVIPRTNDLSERISTKEFIKAYKLPKKLEWFKNMKIAYIFDCYTETNNSFMIESITRAAAGEHFENAMHISIDAILELSLEKKAKWLQLFSQKDKKFAPEILKLFEPMTAKKKEREKERKKKNRGEHRVKNLLRTQ